MEVIYAPASVLLGEYVTTEEPEAVPIHSPRIMRIRAGLGLLCLISGFIALVSFIAIVFTTSPVAGVVFGVSCFILGLTLKVGRKYSSQGPQRDWGSVVETRLD